MSEKLLVGIEKEEENKNNKNTNLKGIHTPYDAGYENYGVIDDNNGSHKEMTLKKVYELALTAIAYLAFGIYILQVIMCITTVKAQTGNMMMMPEVPEVVEMSEVRNTKNTRRKRSNDIKRFSEVSNLQCFTKMLQKYLDTL